MTYDQYGEQSQQPGFDPNFSGRSPFGGGFSGFGGFGGFGGGGGRTGGAGADFFEELFGMGGGGGGQRQAARGQDVDVALDISFLDACKGVLKKVNYSPVVDCGTCDATGLKPGAKRNTCSSCGGSGTRVFVVDGGFQMAGTCPACKGAGSSIPKSGKCGSCDGVGKVRTRKVADINVPPGTFLIYHSLHCQLTTRPQVLRME